MTSAITSALLAGHAVGLAVLVMFASIKTFVWLRESVTGEGEQKRERRDNREWARETKEQAIRERDEDYDEREREFEREE